MLRIFHFSVAFFLFAGKASAEHRAALVLDVHAYEAADLKLSKPDLQPLILSLIHI